MSLHPTLDPQLTGNVGLYYCCYRLSLMGWNVMPTARNARGGRHHCLQPGRFPVRWRSGEGPEQAQPGAAGHIALDNKVMGDFWIIVNKVATAPSAYIMLPSEVTERAHRGEKEGRVSYWLQPADYEHEAFKEAWERIGHGA